MRVIRSVLILAATTLMCSAYGQSQPSLKGVILDISGAVLPSATVRLFSIDQLQETKSDENGEFRFTSLAPGTYTLEATGTGVRASSLDVSLTFAQAVPEPTTIAMLIAGIGLLGWIRLRKSENFG